MPAVATQLPRCYLASRVQLFCCRACCQGYASSRVQLFSCRVPASHAVCTAHQLSCFGFFFPLVQLNQVVLEGSVYSSIAVQLSLAVFFRDASCNPVVIIIYIYIYIYIY